MLPLRINYRKVTAKAFTALLKNQRADQPDMWLPEQAGKLKAISYNSTYLIPKE